MVVFYSLSGCAFLAVNKKDASIDISNFIKESQFDSALSYLEELPDSVYSQKELRKKRRKTNRQ